MEIFSPLKSFKSITVGSPEEYEAKSIYDDTNTYDLREIFTIEKSKNLPKGASIVFTLTSKVPLLKQSYSDISTNSKKNILDNYEQTRCNNMLKSLEISVKINNSTPKEEKTLEKANEELRTLYAKHCRTST